MPRYRIHRIRQIAGENFRWSAHTGGLAIVKIKDYETAGELDASTPYSAWKLLASEGRALHPGDLLESSMDEHAPGTLHIFKYIGFEPAQWYVPEPKADAGSTAHENVEAPVFESHSQPL